MSVQEQSPAIIVSDLTKEFRIPHERRTTLFENLGGAFRPSAYETFEALKGISFAINKGDSVGIIGDNGSGKSTLLKIIAGIIRPSGGSVKINGKITPFLELGVGFQPDLTARENIEVYSTIIGLNSREIAKNMDSVLEFAGMTRFRDTKLKNFSSGMQVRLAFAAAIQTTPDILLVDEVLAVGDMEFQQKCFDVFSDYRRKGVTFVLVSHDLNAVRNYCDKTILLKNGKLVAYDRTGNVIDRYIYGRSDSGNASSATGSQADEPSLTGPDTAGTGREKNASRWGDKAIELTDVHLIDKFGQKSDRFVAGDAMTVLAKYKVNKPVDCPVFGIEITDEKGNYCYGTNTRLRNIPTNNVTEDGSVRIIFSELPLLVGKYHLTIAIASKDLSITHDWIDKKYMFLVMNNTNDVGFIRFKCDFEIPGKEHGKP
jgi:lipopolysaccharide transport system ATP-binding protein